MNFLAFDLGAESGRAILGTLQRDRLRLQEVHRFANQPLRQHGHLLWNLPELWENVRTGLKRAAERSPKLDGIGVDTWGVDYALISRDGQIIGRPYHYRDGRTDDVMDEAIARLGRERIYYTTGIQFLQFNTLFQLLAHVRDEPQSIEQAERLLFMPDVFTFLLSGAKHTEPTIASTSQMYDPRPHRRGWATELVEALGVPSRLLPPIVATGSVNNLLEDVASGSGLKRSCPVISGPGHDTAAAVVAVPAVDERSWCYISSGTWSLMGVELQQPIINPDSLRHNFTNELGFGPTIRFLRNIMGLWLVQECRRAFAEAGQELSYAELTALAAAASACDAVIDPDHPPFFSMGEMPAKIERFCRDTNQSPPSDIAQTIRCCLESLALTYRRTLESLEQLTANRIEVIHIVGGGAQNELLNQMTADACHRTVVAGPLEATAMGNLLVQSMSLGAGDVSSGVAVALQCNGREALRQVRRIVANSFATKRYDPVDPAPWDGKYALFREVAGR